MMMMLPSLKADLLIGDDDDNEDTDDDGDDDNDGDDDDDVTLVKSRPAHW